MASAVYVWPVNLMSGMYEDIHGDSPVADLYNMMTGKSESQGVDGFKVSMLIDCQSTLVAGGRIRIGAAGRWFEGDVEAERSCMLTMVEALRTQYHLFPADFSYVSISEKRALFNAMRSALEPCRADFAMMSAVMKDCHKHVAMLPDLVSVWIGDHHPFVENEDLRAAAEFHAIMSKQAKKMLGDVHHACRLSDVIGLRIVAPEGQARLDCSAPMPMALSWDGSYNTLLRIYDEAVKKFVGRVSETKVAVLADGQFKASVEVLVEPFMFSGEAAPTEKGAMAKLFYVVIKHVKDRLGYSILDFHNDVMEYQLEYIDRFDRNMVNMLKCGEKLMQAYDECRVAFEGSVAELSSKLDVSSATRIVLLGVEGVTSSLSATKDQLDAIWHRFQGRRVFKSNLEAQLAAEA